MTSDLRAWDAPLPPPAPLAMPAQDFHARGPAAPPARRGLLWRRAALILGSGAIGLVASCGIARPLAVDGLDLVDQTIAILCFTLFAWIAFGFLNGLAGLAMLSSGRTRLLPACGAALPGARVAVLLPVYKEDVPALEGRIARMQRSLAAIGGASLFDFFVLSDSPAAFEAAERAACARLAAGWDGVLHYRRRPRNIARKPGNIAEWVQGYGAAYTSMIVLDADSIMTGGAMARLACAMEADPGLGLIQTNPQLTAGETLFARWQQFAVAVYGPVASAGLAWWSGDEATFWGHNAIVRVRAFAESCGLPVLSGPEPFGGHVLSHDMVEAALLRRRGWRVRMMLLADGSYEESPPTLVDHGVRDRRWCQGNLQHLRLLDASGLHWVSRLQLLMGASAYLTSPLWLLLLMIGLFQAVRTGTPMADLGAPPWLVALTATLLFGTRAMALAWAAQDRAIVRMAGGWRRLLTSVAAEVPLSVISAPITMATQCQAIAEIVAGKPSGWNAQRRATDGIALGEALDRYRWHMLLGLMFWTMSLSEVGGALWELPVALGLLGAPFLAVATSRSDVGAALARHGIFALDPAREPAAEMRVAAPGVGLALQPA